MYPITVEVDFPNNYILVARTGYMHVLLDGYSENIDAVTDGE